MSMRMCVGGKQKKKKKKRTSILFHSCRVHNALEWKKIPFTNPSSHRDAKDVGVIPARIQR